MNQNAKKPLERVSFTVCKRCGLHGSIVVQPREGPVCQVFLFPVQPEVWSHEAAILQTMVLVGNGNIDSEEAHELVRQILSTLLSPTEELVDRWQSTMAKKVVNPAAQGASNG